MTKVPTLRTSERRSFKRCPQQWWWAYRQGLTPQEMDLKLWFGIGIHEALAIYYGKGHRRSSKGALDVWHAYCDHDELSVAIKTLPNGNADEKIWVEARKLGDTMLRGYHECWGGDPDWDVIYTEEPFSIEIPDPDNSEKTLGIFASALDGVYRDRSDRHFKLMEHKTAATVQTAHLQLDDQGGSYWAVANRILHHKGILSKQENITEITYNFLRKALPDDRPKNAEGYATNKPTKRHYIEQLTGVDGWAEKELSKKSLEGLANIAAANYVVVLGDVSKIQPQPLFERYPVVRTRAEQRTQIQRIQNELIVMDAFRNGELPLYKNTTRDCHWDCAFFNMCQLHDQNADWEEFRDSVYLVRDPYREKRKAS